jgi:hypothetical protein
MKKSALPTGALVVFAMVAFLAMAKTTSATDKMEGADCDYCYAKNAANPSVA